MVVFCKKYLLIKNKKAEYDKIYRSKNKERYKETDRAYYLNNINKLKEYAKEYALLNKEKIKERKRKYYLKNKEALKDSQKKYRLSHPKVKTGLKSTGNYNITLAERYKEQWLNVKINLYKLKLIDLDGQIFYKYGLAKNIKQRLYYIPYDVEIIELIEMTKYDAVYKEKELLSNVVKYIPSKKFGGYTECFIIK